MEIRDPETGLDLYTSVMAHLANWMPSDGVWQTCWGHGQEPMTTENPSDVPEGYVPASHSPFGQWHACGTGRDPLTAYATLWRRLMVPPVDEDNESGS